MVGFRLPISRSPVDTYVASTLFLSHIDAKCLALISRADTAHTSRAKMALLGPIVLAAEAAFLWLRIVETDARA